MSDAMIDRVSRILADELGHDRVDDLARQIIAALREPTEAMLDDVCGADAKEFEVAPVRAQWISMIDAALGQPK